MVYDPVSFQFGNADRVVTHLLPWACFQFKHDYYGEFRYFISLWENKITFYFSIIEFEKHWLEHHGNYTHHAFSNYSRAEQFYNERTIKYEGSHTIQAIYKEYCHSMRDQSTMGMW